MLPREGLVIVRGGTTQTVERVTYLLEEAVADGDGAVLSVFASTPLDGESIEGTIERICRQADLPHRQILVTSEPSLRMAGVDLVVSADADAALNHHHVVFDVPLKTEQIAAYVAAWNEPLPNPTGGKRKP